MQKNYRPRDFKSEGPTVAKVGKDYLIYYDAYGDFKYGASRTRDFKKFEDVSSQVSLPKGHKHGTIFMVDKKMVEKLRKSPIPNPSPKGKGAGQ